MRTLLIALIILGAVFWVITSMFTKKRTKNKLHIVSNIFLLLAGVLGFIITESALYQTISIFLAIACLLKIILILSDKNKKEK